MTTRPTGRGTYQPDRKPGAIVEAAWWAHGQRNLRELADIAAAGNGSVAAISPIVLEGVDGSTPVRG